MAAEIRQDAAQRRLGGDEVEQCVADAPDLLPVLRHALGSTGILAGQRVPHLGEGAGTV
ncbi:hypothetical protein [Streptomyces sp. NPDC051219]|uniref:hypothetical protein n=1 Tax=Streptomyces sp. NPDC051219 TaxID=3155283 RepID=UPI0034308F25